MVNAGKLQDVLCFHSTPKQNKPVLEAPSLRTRHPYVNCLCHPGCPQVQLGLPRLIRDTSSADAHQRQAGSTGPQQDHLFRGKQRLLCGSKGPPPPVGAGSPLFVLPRSKCSQKEHVAIIRPKGRPEVLGSHQVRISPKGNM